MSFKRQPMDATDLSGIGVSDSEEFLESDYDAAVEWQKLGLFKDYTDYILKGDMYE